MDTASRQGGSSRTILYLGGPTGNVPIVWTESYTETTPELVAQQVEIHPLDWQVPAEIMVAHAMRGGTFELELIENWSQQAWNRFGGALSGLGGNGASGDANTILDVVQAISRADAPSLFITKIVDTPDTSSEDTVRPRRRATFYMNVKIVRITDGEQNLRRDTQMVTKRVMCAYTHRLYHSLPAQRYRPQPAGFPQNVPSVGMASVSGRQLVGNRI